MNREELDHVVADGEGQNLEFKESLSGSAQSEGIESLVAFANARGGVVFFGVRDDRTIVGVQSGKDTLEKLANRIKETTYPSLPVYIEQIDVGNGKSVISAEAWSDTPPLVGVYFASPDHLDPERPVPTKRLRCIRRVGRTNAATNFMHLRAAAATDPDVQITRGSGVTRGVNFPKEWAFTYSNAGPGWAYGLSFVAEHTVYVLQATKGPIDLPPPDQDNPKYATRPRDGTVHAEGEEAAAPSTESAQLIATYNDSMGHAWRSGFELIPDGGMGIVIGKRRRQIVEFPPKAELVGEGANP